MALTAQLQGIMVALQKPETERFAAAREHLAALLWAKDLRENTAQALIDTQNSSDQTP